MKSDIKMKWDLCGEKVLVSFKGIFIALIDREDVLEVFNTLIIFKGNNCKPMDIRIRNQRLLMWKDEFDESIMRIELIDL